MSLITVIIVLVIVGVLLWLINTYIPMAGSVMHDAEDDALQRLTHFNSSTNAYDRWFSEQLTQLHDFDGEETQAQLLFAFDY